MAGWVYIIKNKAMPGILKIGYTERTPYIRAYELYNTGCPYPYRVAYSIYVDKPYEVEQKAHELQRSTNVGKEWFSCSQEQAIETISNAIKICGAKIENRTPRIPTRKEVEDVLVLNTDLPKVEVDKIINNLNKEFYKNKEILKLEDKIEVVEQGVKLTEDLKYDICHIISFYFIFAPILSLPITFIIFMLVKIFFNYNIFVSDDIGWKYYLWGIPVGFLIAKLEKARTKKEFKKLKNQ